MNWVITTKVSTDVMLDQITDITEMEDNIYVAAAVA